MITVFAGSNFMPNFVLFWSLCTDLCMLMNMIVAMYVYMPKIHTARACQGTRIAVFAGFHA